MRIDIKEGRTRHTCEITQEDNEIQVTVARTKDGKVSETTISLDRWTFIDEMRQFLSEISAPSNSICDLLTDDIREGCFKHGSTKENTEELHGRFIIS